MACLMLCSLEQIAVDCGMEALETHAGIKKHFLNFAFLCVMSFLGILIWQYKLGQIVNKNTKMEYLSSYRKNAVFWTPPLRNTQIIIPTLQSDETDTISCDKLIEGDVMEIKRAKKIMSTTSHRNFKSDIYISSTRNCSLYVSSRSYINFTMSEEEEAFPIAFSLLVYKDAQQTERLLRAIWRPHNFYCIHIDKKSNKSFTDGVTSVAKCFQNVFVLPKPVHVKWGKYTVLEPEILCMDLLWKKSKEWKYFINLTGQEFPLKTNYELYLILKSYNGSNDIQGRYKGADRGRWKMKGKPPHNIMPRQGSVHIAASRNFVDYVLHNQKSLDLLKWINGTQIPDETFFGTLNFNPHLKVPGSYAGEVDDGKFDSAWTRYKVWITQGECSGKFVREVCIFSVGDLRRLTTSKYLFANKFHHGYDYLAYDCLENWYHSKVMREKQGHLDFNTSVYSQRWMVNHHF